LPGGDARDSNSQKGGVGGEGAWGELLKQRKGEERDGLFIIIGFVENS